MSSFSPILIMSSPPLIHIDINRMFNLGQRNENTRCLESCNKKIIERVYCIAVWNFYLCWNWHDSFKSKQKWYEVKKYTQQKRPKKDLELGAACRHPLIIRKSFFVFLFPTFKRNSFVLLVNFMWFNSKSFRYLISDTVYINTALSCSFETLSSNRYNLKFTAKLAFGIKLFNVCYIFTV